MTYRIVRFVLGVSVLTMPLACAGAGAPVKLRPYEAVTVVRDDSSLGDKPFEYSTMWEKCDLLGYAAVDEESRKVSTRDAGQAQVDVQGGSASGECVVLCRGTRYVAPCGALTVAN